MQENKSNTWWLSTSDYNSNSALEAIKNAVMSIPTPPLEINRCEKCRTLFEEGKENLCKRCYIRKYGEWRRQ